MSFLRLHGGIVVTVVVELRFVLRLLFELEVLLLWSAMRLVDVPPYELQRLAARRGGKAVFEVQDPDAVKVLFNSDGRQRQGQETSTSSSP